MGLDRFLRRLARSLVRHRLAVVSVTVMLVALAGFFGSSVTKVVSQGGFDAPNEQAVHAANVLAGEFHTGDANFAVLVTARHGNVNSPEVTSSGLLLEHRLAADPQVANVVSYWSLGSLPQLRNAEGTDALIVGRILGDQNQVVQREPRAVSALGPTPRGVTTEVGGFGPTFHEVNVVVEHDLLRAEAIAVPLTMILLFFVFGTPIAAAMPLVIGGVAVVGTLAVLRLLTMFTGVSIFALNLTTVLSLGLGIDYSLFVVSRFREELASGRSVEDAVEETLAHAGRTVLGSALTVGAALAALLVFPLMFLRSFAYAGIAVSLLAGIAALTVLPAVLALLGPRINALCVWRRSVYPPTQGFWSKTASLVMRRPVFVLVGAVAFLLLLGAPFFGLKLGYLDYRVLPPGNSMRMVDDQLASQFSSGQTGTVDVVAPAVAAPERASVATYASTLSDMQGVAQVASTDGVYVHGLRFPAPASYTSQFTSPKGTWYAVVPTGNPQGAAAEALVNRIRGSPSPFPVLVGGITASLVDSTGVIYSRLPLALGLVGAISFLLLLYLFRSLLIPVKALVLNVLSLSATFGAMVWIFQDGHLSRLLDFTATGSLTDTMPILMFCVAFGLSMDYEVFLLSRIKEQHDSGATNEQSVARGLQQSGRIITAAALLMSVVMISLLSSGIAFMKLFAVGLTLAVLMDAFVVRGMLVPAFMRLAGNANWWLPSWGRPSRTKIGVEGWGPIDEETLGLLARDPLEVYSR
jgi:putative drug exporter of the RND superfamily